MEHYAKKQYFSAQMIIDEIMADCNGHVAYDTLLYYSAKIQIHDQKFEGAKLDFAKIARSFSSSVYNEEAQYRVGFCDYHLSNPPERDQTITHETMSELSDFIATYPGSVWSDSATALHASCIEKLAQKELLSARFYETIEQYESAIVYYKSFLENFSQSKLVNEVLVSMGADLIHLNRTAEARDILENLLQNKPDQGITTRAQKMLAKIAKAP